MPGLTFTAVLLADGTVTVEPGFVVDADPTPGDGPVEVLVLGRRGRPIARTTLPVVPVCGPPVPGTEASPVGSVVVGVIEYADWATGLRITVNGQEVWYERELPRGRIDLSWEASTEECVATLAYSADDGATW